MGCVGQRLVQAHGTGHGDVEALHRALHGDAYQRGPRQVFLVSWRMPGPSAPSTRATGPLRFAWYSVPVSLLVPMTQIPRSFSSLRVRARLVTMKYGTVSAAPLATLATVALTPTAWSLGAMTAWAPAPSATRRQAPRLCGSVTPSSTRISGAETPCPSSSSSRSSSECSGSTACTRAATPWGPWLPASLAMRKPSASINRAPASRARSRNWRMRASRRVGS